MATPADGRGSGLPGLLAEALGDALVAGLVDGLPEGLADGSAEGLVEGLVDGAAARQEERCAFAPCVAPCLHYVTPWHQKKEKGRFFFLLFPDGEKPQGMHASHIFPLAA